MSGQRVCGILVVLFSSSQFILMGTWCLDVCHNTAKKNSPTQGFSVWFVVSELQAKYILFVAWKNSTYH